MKGSIGERRAWPTVTRSPLRCSRASRSLSRPSGVEASLRYAGRSNPHERRSLSVTHANRGVVRRTHPSVFIAPSSLAPSSLAPSPCPLPHRGRGFCLLPLSPPFLPLPSAERVLFSPSPLWGGGRVRGGRGSTRTGAG